MRIVVDTNIVFSAILNTNNVIADIILHPKNRLNFYSTEQLLFEIHEHKDKIKKLSTYTDTELDRLILLFSNRIRFINVKLIPKEIYSKSELLTTNVDIDDTEFIALTDHIKGKFWSGDKVLRNGLIKKKWNKFISTDELSQLIKRRK